MMLPVVAIVGRPNVGKSSMFNRLIHRKLAVVDKTPGVTRDRNFSKCEWTGHEFYLIDTGGMVPGSDDSMERLIMEQAEIGTDEADIILFLVDCQTGITDLDARIAAKLRRTKKPLILVVNKADNERLEIDSNDFYRLGIDPLFAVSAIGGRGIGDLLDGLVELLPHEDHQPEEEGSIRVAVVGRPNVGKSSFVNQLLGVERHIVSDIPGTTRDSIDSPVTIDGRKYTLIDTAGLRRKSKVKESVEFYTALRTVRAIQRCDVALILIDANEGLNFQELKIIEEVGEAGRAMVLAVNKWDVFDKDDKSAQYYMKQLNEAIPTYSYIPAIFTSALTGQRVTKALSLIDSVYAEYTKRIATSTLNQFLEDIIRRQSPAAVKGKWIKLLYITQADICPPKFIIFCNYPKLIQDSYVRYITNRMRERFGFEGVPLDIKLKPRKG